MSEGHSITKFTHGGKRPGAGRPIGSRNKDTPQREGSQTCKDCKQLRPFSDFSKTSNMCCHCLRVHQLVKRGLPNARYLEMYLEQNGVCAICQCPETARVSKAGMATRTLSIDHNHKTGKVRALICHQCNIMLGAARDNVDTLAAAIEYLKRFVDVENIQE